jgi:energy-coupling factor transporter ATP-binding protein EcfA2
MTAPLLQAFIKSFTFHGDTTPAVRDVEITVEAATLTSVLGGSGSGKSTLGRLFAGWLGSGDGELQGRLALGGDGIPEGGQVLEFSGKGEDPRINPSAWSRHVGYVPQDSASVLSQVRSTVEEELAFGLENRGVDPATMHREVGEAARLTGISHLLTRDPGSLSGGELRRLAIACSVITGPGLLILDDPLASLDHDGADLIRKLITKLISQGTAVIVLGQVMDSLASRAGYCLVLDGGTVTAGGTPAEVLASRGLAESGVVVPARRPRGSAVQRGEIPGSPALELRDVAYSLPPAANALERRGVGRIRRRDPRPASGIQAARPVLAGVDLQVEQGQIVAITGPNGAGKTTLLRHLNGLLRPERGEVVVCGRSIEGRSTGAISADVGLLFQNPRDQLFERTLLREVRFGLDRLFDGDADQRALRALGDVGLGASAAHHPYDLPASGQRLLTLATVLVREPAILALDEPTVGLDRHGLARLDAALRAAAARGAAVVLVTHDVQFARDTAHRTLVLSGGRLREL